MSRLRRFVLLGALAGALAFPAACDDDGPEESAGPEVPTEAPATLTEAPTTPTEAPTTPTEATAAPGTGEDGDLVGRGEELVNSSGCTACHGAGIAPDFGEIGSEETLADGETVQVDQEYLRRSIVDPDAQIVEGYSGGLMPQDYEQQLSDDQIGAIVEYILSLQ